MPSALIVYASLTGNTEEIAELLEASFKKRDVDVIVEECTQVDADEYLKYDICVVATYTYGSDGDLPDEIELFYEDLANVNLAGKIFGVLGSGEEVYEKFCQSVDDFEAQFNKTGAVQGAKSLKIEGMSMPNDEFKIDLFAENLLRTFQKRETVVV